MNKLYKSYNKIIVILVIVIVLLSGCSKDRKDIVEQRTDTNRFEFIRDASSISYQAYLIIDKQTGREYLCIARTNGGTAITPLEDGERVCH